MVREAVMSLHAVSLFTGIGGIDLAFERAGVPTIVQCEADKAARSVLARRFPHAPLQHHDVQELTADDGHAWDDDVPWWIAPSCIYSKGEK